MMGMRGYWRAYCSSANLGSGFDVVAVALDAYYDEAWVEVEEAPETEVCIAEIRGPYSGDVPYRDNTVVGALKHLFRLMNLNARAYVKLWKGIPVGKGLGSSGASAAAAVGAAARALEIALPTERAVEAAGRGEIASAGAPHYDNVSASLLGGVSVLYSLRPIRVFSFTPRKKLEFVLAIPGCSTPHRKTELMRSVVPRTIGLESHVANSGRLAALVLGLYLGDARLVGSGMADCIVEPARAPYVPAYDRVRKHALEAGARGVAISGAGPSVIAICDGDSYGVKGAIEEAYIEEGIDVEVTVACPVPASQDSGRFLPWARRNISFC